MDVKETGYHCVNWIHCDSHGSGNVNVGLLTPCELVDRYRRFGATHYLHFQGCDMLSSLLICIHSNKVVT